MSGLSIQPRDRIAALVLVLGLIASSTVGIVETQSGAHRTAALPPTPPSPGSSTSAPVGTSQSTAPKTHAASPPVRCSARASDAGGDQPVQLCIASLAVDTPVMSLGLNADRTVEVPPLSRVGEAGWYRNSAAPGAVGPTVILGHVDSAQYGEGVFFHLARLHGGSEVELRRGDGRIAVYRIDKVVEVAKNRFPTDAVYGPTSGPAIRLVTCGGQFDASTGNYLDNIIAFGTLLHLLVA